MNFTTNLLLQLHRDLFKFAGGGDAGRWKTADNVISEKRPDGATIVRFAPTPAWKTPDAMNALHIEFVAAAASNIDPLILIGLYILDFLCIHPFSDGNGRLARIITVLLLYREDFEVARYISLERLIENTKESYYDTLHRSSQGWHESKHDPMPWVSYFLGVVRAAYGEFARDVGELKDGRGMKTQLVLWAIRDRVGDFSISEIHEQCPSVGLAMLRRVLRAERDAGRIGVIGKGRASRWRKIEFAANVACSDERG